MGDLATDTSVLATAGGRFTAELSPDWEIWGPNGGYLAAVALRAAGAEMGRSRPVSIAAHLVAAGRSGTVDIVVETNRATKVATSVTVTLTQDDRPWLTAMVWGVDDDLDGIEHHIERRPIDAADPESLPSVEELVGDADAMPHPFWRNFDVRPLNWIVDWEHREPSEPEVGGWYRFVPTETFDDPWVDACRSLILIDLDSWPAAMRAHVGEVEHYGPTIDVTARFLAPTGEEPWLLSWAQSPVARDGLIGATAQIRNREQQIVAIGGSTLLCRPATRRPDR